MAIFLGSILDRPLVGGACRTALRQSPRGSHYPSVPDEKRLRGLFATDFASDQNRSRERRRRARRGNCGSHCCSSDCSSGSGQVGGRRRGAGHRA